MVILVRGLSNILNFRGKVMRTKNSFKTIVYGFILTGIIAILGLFKTKVLLSYLGEDSVAIYQLFAQIYTYLSLVDGGVSSAMIYYLYQPIRDKNYEDINAKINGVRKYFRNIGFIIIAIGLVLSINIMFFINETSLTPMYIRISFIIFIVASACSYFAASHAILYEAEQKLYKSSNLNHGLNIAKGVFEIILAMLGFDLVTLMVSFLVLSIIKNLILYFMSRREHKFLSKVSKTDMAFKKEANNLLVQKVSTLIFENIDVILLSKYTTPVTVVIYTAYYQITHMVTLMIKRINSAIIPGIGDMLLDAKNDHVVGIFDEINSLLFYLAIVICVPLYFVLNPFIDLWYGARYMASSLVSLLFVLVLFITIISIVLDVYIRSSGNFKAIKYWSLYQCIVNLVFSFILVQKIGILGVLIGTVFSFFTGNFINYPRIVSKKVLKRKTRVYYQKCFIYLLALIPSIGVCYLVNSCFTYTSLLTWVLAGVLIFCLNLIIVTIYFYLTHNMTFMNRFKYMLRRKKA